ncbi:MAG: hypothetical protein HZA28_06640, partial [Candidatus Omnitrophica bacterium]|nr:hypothetical protein [Candidatus Omnitrophota bacterium]
CNTHSFPLHLGAGDVQVRVLICVHDVHGPQLPQPLHCPLTSSSVPRHCSVAILSTPLNIRFSAWFTP